MIYRRSGGFIRFYLILSALCFLNSLVYSQYNKTDSLIKIYSKSSNVREKLDIARKIVIENYHNDSVVFLKYCKQAIALSEKLDDQFTKARIYIALGYFYSEKDFLTAYDYANKGLAIYTELDSLKYKSQAYTLLGSVYFYIGNYRKAFENYIESLKINEHLKSELYLAVDYNNIAIIYSEQKNNSKALEYYFKALAINKKYSQTDSYVNNLMNISVAYGDIDSIEQQYKYGNEALKISRECKFDLAPILLNMGDIYVKTKEFQKAEDCFNEAEDIFKRQGSNYYLNYLYLSLGNLYKAKNQLDVAIVYYEKALEYARKDKIQPLIKDCSLALSSLYKTKNDFQKSLSYYELFHGTFDSLESIENTKKITEFELQYKFDKQIEVKKKEEESSQKLLQLQQRIILFFIVVLVLAICLIMLIVKNYRLAQRTNKLLSEQNSQIQDQSTELRKQRDQLKHLNATKDKLYSIIAHDLKNPFNVIMGFSTLLVERWHEIDDKRKIQYIDMMNKSANNTFDLLRNLLDWARSQSGKLHVDAKCVEVNQLVNETLLFVENYAKTKRIKISTEIDTSIKVFVDPNMMSTVLRNLLSNAIKFTNENGKVSIYCKPISDGKVSVIVEDTGVGLTDEALSSIFSIENHVTTEGTCNEQGTGLGLILCKEFIEKNQGKISVESVVGIGSKFMVTLPSC